MGEKVKKLDKVNEYAAGYVKKGTFVTRKKFKRLRSHG